MLNILANKTITEKIHIIGKKNDGLNGACTNTFCFVGRWEEQNTYNLVIKILILELLG